MAALNLDLSKDLLDKLEKASMQTGKSKNEIVIALLQRELNNENSLLTAIEKMRKGKYPEKKVNIARLFENTEPYFKTVDEAIEYSRN